MTKQRKKNSQENEDIDVVFTYIKDLKEHEEVDEQEVKNIVSKIESRGVIRKPIIVDKKTNLILDGHCRFNALKRLGCLKIPVIYVDLMSPDIMVEAWRKGEKISKNDLIKAISNGIKMPPKTSKHMIKIDGKRMHISIIEKDVNIPLKNLLPVDRETK